MSTIESSAWGVVLQANGEFLQINPDMSITPRFSTNSPQPREREFGLSSTGDICYFRNVIEVMVCVDPSGIGWSPADYGLWLENLKFGATDTMYNAVSAQ